MFGATTRLLITIRGNGLLQGGVRGRVDQRTIFNIICPFGRVNMFGVNRSCKSTIMIRRYNDIQGGVLTLVFKG